MIVGKARLFFFIGRITARYPKVMLVMSLKFNRSENILYMYENAHTNKTLRL